MARITVTGCRALVGVPPEPSNGPVDIVIRDNRIDEIRPADIAPPEGEAIDGRRLLVTAGLINGHTHSHENFHKGRYENLPLELWMNFVRPPDPIPITSRQVYLRTLIGVIEALRSGTTTIVDDLNVTPVLVPEHVEAVLQAYRDSGIRALVAPGMFDQPFYATAPFVKETFPRSLQEALAAKQRSSPQEVMDFVRNLAAGYDPRPQRVGLAISPSAPQRCSEVYLRAVRALADEHDLPVVIHVQETRLQVITGRLFYGCTMIEYLDRIGFLRPGVSIIHGVWLNPREIEILARSGATLQHNPTSNLSLGSGLSPVRRLLDAGVNVSLGTDACGSSFTVNMLKVVNNAAQLGKLRGDDYGKWLTASEVWTAGTVGGAKALGLGADLGAVETGRLADLTGYRLDSIPFTPLNDPLRQLVYAETGQELDLVLVDGEVVMRDGRLVRLDEAALLGEIAAEFETLQPHLDAADASVAEIRGAYEKIYRRCLKEAIADDTYPARFP